MYKVRTFNQIALRGLERFPRDGFEVGTEIPDPHAILLRSHVLTADHVTPNLRAVARAGAGVNNVPVEHYTERGIVVFNTPGANANSVKELVLAALLLSARDVLGGLDYVASIKGVTDAAELNKRVGGGEEALPGRRDLRQNARRRGPRRDRRARRRSGSASRHERARLRPCDIGRCRVAAAE